MCVKSYKQILLREGIKAMQHSFIHFLLIAIHTLGLTACIPYPVYKTTQPAGQVTVLDARFTPLGGAKVTLIANAYPYGREKTRETRQTDRSGTISFEIRQEWRTEVLMIHGADVYFWNWCVEKPGFVTFITHYTGNKEFIAEPIIRLEKGDSTPCASLKW